MFTITAVGVSTAPSNLSVCLVIHVGDCGGYWAGTWRQAVSWGLGLVVFFFKFQFAACWHFELSEQ